LLALTRRRRSYVVASASLFAALYAVLGLIPISPYVGLGSFLSFREILPPLAGMLFGPLTGGLSMLVGGFVDIGLRGSSNFDFLDFVPDLVGAATAGFCFTGRRKEALALPLIFTVAYCVEPLSAAFVSVGGVPIPFVWMHVASFAVLAGILLLERNGRLNRLSTVFVASTVFASVMAAHISGSVVYEEILVRVNHVLTPQTIQANWVVIFSLYPEERIFFTIVGTLIAIPVLRALSRRTREVATGGAPQPGPSV
jgi:hypothetical protein